MWGPLSFGEVSLGYKAETKETWARMPCPSSFIARLTITTSLGSPLANVQCCWLLTSSYNMEGSRPPFDAGTDVLIYPERNIRNIQRVLSSGSTNNNSVNNGSLGGANGQISYVWRRGRYLLSEIAGVCLVCSSFFFLFRCSSVWSDTDALLDCYEDSKHLSPGLYFVL